MYLNLFQSFLSSASASGGFSVQLQTFNAESNITLTLVATGITAGMGETDMAQTANTQFQTQLIQYGILYSGVPAFSSQTPQASFRIFNTDHVLTYWSEALFKLTLVTNTTGAQIKCDHEVYLITLTDFDSLVGVVDIGNTTLTTNQKILLIKVASSQLTSALNNNFVICGFTNTTTGSWQTAIFLRGGRPVIDWDAPHVAFPSAIPYSLYPEAPNPKLLWSLNPLTGQLFYKAWQNVANIVEPWSLNNECKTSYYAGNFNLPGALLFGIIQIITATLENRAGIKSIKTGSFETVFLDRGAFITVVDELWNEYSL